MRLRCFLAALVLIQPLAAQVKKVPLGNNVNSKHDELAPILSPDGQTLFFCREGDPRNTGFKQQSDDQDIWVSRVDAAGNFGPAEHLEAAFNSRVYDFPIGTSADGKTLYIGNSYSKDGSITSGVSRTRFINGKWTFPESLKIEDYYNEANLVNYSVGADEKTLILNVQRSDSLGKMDLYVSFLREDDTWTAPVNLGENINSQHQEVTPYLASDMRTLYFSSNRPGGQGGFDMYVSRRLDDTWESWSAPKNLGAEINTKGNDISYVISPDGEYAIFSSESPQGNKDLYKVILPKAVRPSVNTVVTGTVVNTEKQVLEAKIIYERLSDGKVMGNSFSDPENGTFKVSLPQNEKYSLRAEKEGFLPVTELVDLTGKKTEVPPVTLVLTALKKGSKITLNSIFFKRRSWELTTESNSELNRLVKILNDAPGLKIQVEGHTDNVGSLKYNQDLSDKRAASVVTYLTSKGIDKKRLSSKGFGETKPISTNDTDAGRSKNRRVEFVIVSE